MLYCPVLLWACHVLCYTALCYTALCYPVLCCTTAAAAAAAAAAAGKSVVVTVGTEQSVIELSELSVLNDSAGAGPAAFKFKFWTVCWRVVHCDCWN